MRDRFFSFVILCWIKNYYSSIRQRSSVMMPGWGSTFSWLSMFLMERSAIIFELPGTAFLILMLTFPLFHFFFRSFSATGHKQTTYLHNKKRSCAVFICSSLCAIRRGRQELWSDNLTFAPGLHRLEQLFVLVIVAMHVERHCTETRERL